MQSPRRHWTPGSIWPHVSRRLHDLYTALRGHFGYQPAWWPGTSWEIAVSAIFVQQCDWTVAFRGVQLLNGSGINGLRSVAKSSPEQVHQCIRSISFAPTKSHRLVEFARHLSDLGFESIDDYFASAETDKLRDDLMSLRGIGHETADAMLLFAGSSHLTFIIDAYTRRIVSRVEIGSEIDARFWKQPAPRLRQFLLEHLLADFSSYDEFTLDSSIPREVALLRDYHAQLVELGRHHCLKTRPRCHSTGKHGWTDYEFCFKHCLADICIGCPLSSSCEHAIEAGRNPSQCD